jgi:hypothetical protein
VDACYERTVPLPLVPLIAALVGVAFALVGRDEVRRSTTPPTQTRGFLLVTVCAYALLAPAAGYFLAFYPDWAWCYLLPGGRVPSAVDLLAATLAVGAAPIAFVWTASALRRHAVRDLVRGAGVLVVLTAIATGLLGSRLGVAGTYTAFREGYDLVPVGGTSLGVSILWIDACLLGGMAWAATRLRAVEPVRARARASSPGAKVRG